MFATSLLAFVFCLFLGLFLGFWTSKFQSLERPHVLWILVSYLQTLHQPFCALLLPCLPHHQILNWLSFQYILLQVILISLQELALKKMKQVSACNSDLGYAQVVIPQFFIFWFFLTITGSYSLTLSFTVLMLLIGDLVLENLYIENL